MEFNNKGKCIKIKQTEYEEVYEIYASSTCFITAVEKVEDYLKLKFPEWNKSKITYVSSNLLSAVIYKYKYMRVVH